MARGKALTRDQLKLMTAELCCVLWKDGSFTSHLEKVGFSDKHIMLKAAEETGIIKKNTNTNRFEIVNKQPDPTPLFNKYMFLRTAESERLAKEYRKKTGQLTVTVNAPDRRAVPDTQPTPAEELMFQILQAQAVEIISLNNKMNLILKSLGIDQNPKKDV